uniref:Uncharacterized protein n=1 Tax=Solanum tuberosum TaxID=4113 RepID=M1APR6_SOLTU
MGDGRSGSIHSSLGATWFHLKATRTDSQLLADAFLMKSYKFERDVAEKTTTNRRVLIHASKA